MNFDDFTRSSEFKNVDDASTYYRNKLNESKTNSPAITIIDNRPRITNILEVDVKLWEARQALCLGLTISSIVMMSVALEETLKYLIKTKLKQQATPQPSGIEQFDDLTVSIEQNWGGKTLHKCIGKARSLEIITEEEKEWLLKTEDEIRHAYIHSDKSKMFGTEKNIPTQEATIEGERIVVDPAKNVSGLGFSFAHGIMEKILADERAPVIVYEIYDFIIKLTDKTAPTINT